MKPTIVLIVLGLSWTTLAQQQPSSTAKLFIYPGAPMENGYYAPFATTIHLPSSPVLSCRGGVGQPVGLYLGVLSPGFLYSPTVGSIDLDLATLLTLVP